MAASAPGPRPQGRRGRVVVVGGNAGMTGALRLAARAAFGAGAGLVHAVAPPETIAVLVQAEPDVQTLAQPFDQPLSAPARSGRPRRRPCDRSRSWSRARAPCTGHGL